MKKFLLFSLLITAFLSCKKQELKLPILHTNALDSVYNNSAVWIFYVIKNKDTLAQLNQNNSIETTNWLFNIDGRLSLKQIYKPFKKLLKKRLKKSIHHIEGLKNYFSFADTLDKRNKFLEFNLKDVQYKKPVLKDSNSTTSIFKFYKKYFQLNNNKFSYVKFDSVINSKKVYKDIKYKYYYQDNISFNTYLKIKNNLYKYPFLRAIDNTLDFYFK